MSDIGDFDSIDMASAAARLDEALVNHRHSQAASLAIRRDHLASLTFRTCATAILDALTADGWTLTHDNICRHIWHDNIEPVDSQCPRCGAGTWPTR